MFKGGIWKEGIPHGHSHWPGMCTGLFDEGKGGNRVGRAAGPTFLYLALIK